MLTSTGSLYVADTVECQDYALVDVKPAYDIAKCPILFVDLDNITDAQYVINREYDMPGFTAMDGFRIKIYPHATCKCLSPEAQSTITST